MKRLNYPPALAGATEAVASSGGQIMPPLMGAGAFVMVELTGIRYADIIVAALLPAILYFFVIWQGINAFSRRYELPAINAEQIPQVRTLIISTSFFLIPFTLLLVGMFVFSLTATYAACLAIIAAVLLLVTDEKLNISVQAIIARIRTTSVTAGKQIATIAAIITCASIIVGVLGLTGLGVKITSLILSASGGQLWLALLLTALACLLLGMEVPTTAAYVICVSIAGPALTELGLAPLQVHLFVFWYALLSTITPPVCGAVFIAAGIANENWLKVALFAMGLGIGLYLIPIAMISAPALIAIDKFSLIVVASFVKTLAALWLIVEALLAPGTLIRRMFYALLGLSILLIPLRLDYL